MADNLTQKSVKTVEKNKHNTVIHRTTSETLRLGEPDRVAAHPTSLTASTPNPRKKISSFQITSVTGSRMSNDGGDDSADDLDESHTDDNSRITDFENETPSYSEDTYSKEDVFFNASNALGVAPVIPTSAQYGLVIVPPESVGIQGGVTINSENNVDVPDVHVSVTEASAGSVINIVANTKTSDTEMKDLHANPSRNDRFKVVKIESTEPFKRGRWMCMDYLDHTTTPASQGAVINVKDGADLNQVVTGPDSGVVLSDNPETMSIGSPVKTIYVQEASQMPSNNNLQSSSVNYASVSPGQSLHQIPVSTDTNLVYVIPQTIPPPASQGMYSSPNEVMQSNNYQETNSNSSAQPQSVHPQAQSMSQVPIQQVVNQQPPPPQISQHQSLPPQQLQQVIAQANNQQQQQSQQQQQQPQQQPQLQQQQQTQQQQQQTQQQQQQPHQQQAQQQLQNQQQGQQQHQQQVGQHQQQQPQQQSQQQQPSQTQSQSQQQQSLPHAQTTMQPNVTNQQINQGTQFTQGQSMPAQFFTPGQQQQSDGQQQTMPVQYVAQRPAAGQNGQQQPQIQNQQMPQQPTQMQQSAGQSMPAMSMGQMIPPAQSQGTNDVASQGQPQAQHMMPGSQQPSSQQMTSPSQQQQYYPQTQTNTSQNSTAQTTMPNVANMHQSLPQGAIQMVNQQQQPQITSATTGTQQSMQMPMQVQQGQSLPHNIINTSQPMPTQQNAQVPLQTQTQGQAQGQTQMPVSQQQPVQNTGMQLPQQSVQMPQQQPQAPQQQIPTQMGSQYTTTSVGQNTVSPQTNANTTHTQQSSNTVSASGTQNFNTQGHNYTTPNGVVVPAVMNNLVNNIEGVNSVDGQSGGGTPAEITLPEAVEVLTAVSEEMQNQQASAEEGDSFCGLAMALATSRSSYRIAGSTATMELSFKPPSKVTSAGGAGAALRPQSSTPSSRAASPQPHASDTDAAHSASGTSAVAIDNKIEQAMDLVKSHLMFAVREEVEVLKERIAELMERINQLEVENNILRAHASQETLSQLNTAPNQNQTATPVTVKPQPSNPANGPIS